MKKVLKTLAISLVAWGLVLTQGLYAKNSQSNQDKPTFALYDSNKDNKITKQEFNQAREARITKRANEGRQLKNVTNTQPFSQLDTNKDGFLQKDEFDAHLQNNSKNNKQKNKKGQGKKKRIKIKM